MSISLDPLRPYLPIVYAVGVALILSVVFVGGCRHGKAGAADDVAKAETQRDEAYASAAASRTALDEISAKTEADKKEAQARAKAAEQAVGEAEKEADRQARIAADAKRRLAEAAKDPKCATLLEMELCASVPLL